MNKMFSQKSKKIILGTVQFGLDYGINNQKGKPSYRQVKNILDYAHSSGISILDTAEAYGNSHEVIGRYIKETTQKFKIISKYSFARKDLPNDIYERITKNIKVLGVESLYGYLFHSFDEYVQHFDLFKKGFVKLKEEGLLHKVGVSVYTNSQLLKVLENEFIEIIQLPFNAFDNINIRGEVLEKAKKKGVEIHTRSIFLQGLFFKKENELNGNLKEFKESIEEFNEISKVNNISKASLALNYGLAQENIDYVLIGVDNNEQLKNNMNSLEIDGEAEMLIRSKIDLIEIENKKLLNPSTWRV